MNTREAVQDALSDWVLPNERIDSILAEDTVGGRDTGWPAMSVHAEEGKFIYTLIRILQPPIVVEIGVASGCSTTHILAALERNRMGFLYSFDIEPLAGQSVPDFLKQRWDFTVADGRYVDLPSADFVLEDSVHEYDPAKEVLENVKSTDPKYVVSHDVLSHLVYPDFGIGRAFKEVFGSDAKAYGIDGAFTGVGFWRNNAKGI